MPITPQQLREELTRGGRFTPDEINEFIARHEQIERERAAWRVLGLGIGQPRATSDSDPLAVGNIPPHDRSMADADRLAKLEGAYDSLKVVRPMTLTLVSVFLGIVALAFTVVAFQLGQFGTRIDRLEAKVDAIPQRLSDEFRALRAEMSAQTSAIANSITATRQAQPPAPPQIILIPPAPQPQPIPEAPKP